MNCQKDALANGDVARNDGKITLEDVMTLLYYLEWTNYIIFES